MFVRVGNRRTFDDDPFRLVGATRKLRRASPCVNDPEQPFYIIGTSCGCYQWVDGLPATQTTQIASVSIVWNAGLALEGSVFR